MCFDLFIICKSTKILKYIYFNEDAMFGVKIVNLVLKLYVNSLKLFASKEKLPI